MYVINISKRWQFSACAVCITQAGLYSALYVASSSSTTLFPYTVWLLVCDLCSVEMMAHVLQQNTSQLWESKVQCFKVQSLNFHFIRQTIMLP
jgi:hypothetical protein